MSPAAYGQRRDGWCEGAHIFYLSYPLLNFKLSPGLFNTPVSLNYRLEKPRFPSPAFVFLINLGLALKFSLVPLHNFVAGQRGSLGRDSRLPNSIYGTPGQLRLSLSRPIPYERGGCPSWQCPRRCPRGILVLRVPFRGSPVPISLSR